MDRRRDVFVEDVLHGGDRGIGASLIRALLVPLALLHRIGLEIYLLPYNIGLRKRYRLPVPVIAIGNLSSGGTGKTPMAALVAGRLRTEGHRVVLLSRGHGGSGESGHTPRIVSDGETVLLGPEAAGDEPVLLARSLPGVPVVVGRDRRRSGKLAMETFQPDIIVLDDALQYWQLYRDLNIILLDARRPFDNGWVLPRGLLREPPSHLARAGIVVLTRSDRVSPKALAEAKAEVTRLAPKTASFAAIHAPRDWVRASDGAMFSLEALAEILAGAAGMSFSGIADGIAFRITVEGIGVSIPASLTFPDHFAYTPESVADIVTALHDSGMAFAVTTEKDLVKVAPLWPPDAPTLYALRIGMRLDNEDAFFERVYSVTGTEKDV